MKLFKKITGAVVAIALVLTAVFAFAFTDKKEQNNKVIEQVYYHVGDNYQKTPPPMGTSCDLDDYYCTVTLDGINLPESFLEDEIPASNPDFTVTTGTANASWK